MSCLGCLKSRREQTRSSASIVSDLHVTGTQQYFSLIVFGGLSNWSYKKLIHDMAAMVEQAMNQVGVETNLLFFFVDIRQEFQGQQMFTTNGEAADSSKYKINYEDTNFREALLMANKTFPEFLWLEKAFQKDVLNKLTEQMFYVYIPIDGTGPTHSKLANTRIEEIERKVSAAGNWDRIFYASIPPSAFMQFGSTVAEFLRAPSPGNTRVIVEKPYGMNKDQAVNLNRHLEGLFPNQVFRTDHFLAMNCVRWIPFLRFCKSDNTIIESVQHKWNKESVEKISVRWSTQGDLRDGRAHTYFDKVGVVRDMIQNHIFVMMLVATMNRPTVSEQQQQPSASPAASARSSGSPVSHNVAVGGGGGVLGYINVNESTHTAAISDMHQKHEQAIARYRTEIASQISPLQRQSITLGQYDRYSSEHGGSELTPTAFHFATSVSNMKANILGGVPIIGTGAYGTKDRIFEVVLTLKSGQEIFVEGVECNTVRINFQANLMELLNAATQKVGAVVNFQNLCKKATQLWEVMGGEKGYFVGQDEVVAAWEFVQAVLDEPQCVQYAQGSSWSDTFHILQSHKPLTS